MVVVRVKQLYPGAKIPTRAHPDDACFDLYAYHPESKIRIHPGERVMIKTGVAFAIPSGYEGVVRPRSGWTFDTHLRIANSPGTIDSGYRGEVMIIMENISNNEKDVYVIEHGQRIAQIGFRRVPPIELVEVDKLDDTERGDGGFGSTGDF